MIAETVARPIAPVRPREAEKQARMAQRRKESQWLIAGLVTADVVFVLLAIATTALLRLTLDGFLPVAALGLPERHVFASLLAAPVLVSLLWLHGLYDIDAILAGSREYGRIAHAVTYGVLIVLGASYFLGDGPLVSRSWLLLLWLSSIVLLGVGRFAARRVVRRFRRRGVLRTRVVVVGASALGVTIAEQLRAASNEGLDVVGFLDEYIPIGQPLVGDIGVIGRPSDLVRGNIHRVVDEYLLVPQAMPHERLQEITRLMVARNGPTLRMAVSSSDLLTHGVLVAERASVPLVTMKRARITGIDALLKRALDLVGASVALVALGPVAAVAMLLLGARGRVRLVRQDVRGACGEPTSFMLFDMAAMGWLPLRGVPALVAVLAGRLSLVGPRPATSDWSPLGTEELRFTAVKPGLTGPWRLSGPSASLADQALLDLAYIRDYTIWEDLRIVAQSLSMLRSARPERQLGRWQPACASPAGQFSSTASQ